MRMDVHDQMRSREGHMRRARNADMILKRTGKCKSGDGQQREFACMYIRTQGTAEVAWGD